jgi:hypothetical protein
MGLSYGFAQFNKRGDKPAVINLTLAIAGFCYNIEKQKGPD